MFLRRIPVGAIESNCYLFGDGIIIDPGADGDFILETIKKVGFKPRKIVLTHSHYDHIGAALFLKERFKIDILAHSSSAKYLQNSDLNLSSFFGDPVSFTPDVFLENDDLIASDTTHLSAIHTPGHSLCSICLYDGEGILFSGDTLFDGGYGRYDLPGSDFNQLKTSLKKILSLPDDTVFYPGHGGHSTVGKAKRQLESMLR